LQKQVVAAAIFHFLYVPVLLFVMLESFKYFENFKTLTQKLPTLGQPFAVAKT